jgi:hypothetical protein
MPHQFAARFVLALPTSCWRKSRCPRLPCPPVETSYSKVIVVAGYANKLAGLANSLRESVCSVYISVDNVYVCNHIMALHDTVTRTCWT